MYKLLGDNYVFVATEPMEKERKDMGWDLNSKYPYEIRSYENNATAKRALQLAIDSDVMIIGSAPEFYVNERMKSGNKLTFRYSERIYKKGTWRAASPRGMCYRYKTYFRYINKPIYMLCASAYTSGDLAILGSYLGRCYKWGYFPEVIEHNLDELMNKKKNERTKILWVGRFIDLKHTEDVIEIAKKLKVDGYNLSLDIIGTGEREQYLKELTNKYKLNDTVTFLGSMKPYQVREHMEKSNIYLFTSDFNEGWGAVLNEAMNSGCAVVASHAIGSVPYLIYNEENGLVYKNGDLEGLFQCVKTLLEDNVLAKQLGKNAYKTISETWNAKIAAERLLILFDSLIKGENFYVEEGPCSKAESIPQRKMYNSIIQKKDY